LPHGSIPATINDIIKFFRSPFLNVIIPNEFIGRKGISSPFVSIRKGEAENYSVKIQTLRRCDLWIGRPICWVLTVAHKIKRFFVTKKPLDVPRKVLFIKLFGMGSIILSFPTMNALKQKHPESSFYFLTFKENEPLLNMVNIIPRKNIFTVRKDTLTHLMTDVFSNLFWLVRERFDVVIDLEFFSRFTAIMSFLIRSRHRIGFFGFHVEGLKRGAFIDSQINYNHTLHTSRAFFTLLKPFGISQYDYKPAPIRIPASAGFAQNLNATIRKANSLCATEVISKWIMLNPNASDLSELRRWPKGHFSRLAELLLAEDKSIGIIFTGSKSERIYVESICASLSGDTASRIVNLAGLTSLSDLIDLFHFSHLFITSDSGPAHLSSLTDIPGIVLFGPETPDIYSPIGSRSRCLYLGLDCQPCITVYNGKRSFCEDNVCLQRISPEYVLELAIGILSKNKESDMHHKHGVPL
jgi:ADP-heptose:LPS heptosyltransferase